MRILSKKAYLKLHYLTGLAGFVSAGLLGIYVRSIFIIIIAVAIYLAVGVYKILLADYNIYDCLR